MGERINIQNLIDLLADKKGLSKKEAERFLKEMFNLIEEALEKEQYLKIKGFGTFKLIAVDSRESVNVNTGERIEIQGHTKISFTPEASLRDQVNRPFAHFETVILNELAVFDDLSQVDETLENVDDSAFLNEEEQVEAPESKDIDEEQIQEEIRTIDETLEPTIEDTSEFFVSPESEIENQEEAIILEAQDEQSEAEQEQVPQDVIYDSESNKQDDLEENNDSEEEIIEQNSLLTEDVISETNDQDEISEDKNRKYSLVYLITIAVFILVFLGGVFTYIYNPDFVMNIFSDLQPTEQQFDNTVKTDSIDKVTKQSNDSLALLKVEKDRINNDTTKTIISGLDEVNATIQPDSTRYMIVGTMEKYTVKAGDGLMRISKHFYESKNLWPYIVKCNPKIRKSPNNVVQGTVLIIPALRDKK